MRPVLRSCLLSLVVGLTGCGGRSATEPIGEFVAGRVADAGALTLRSWNGVHQGFDADFALTLRRDGRCEVEATGDALRYYHGRYKLAPDGRLDVTLTEEVEAGPETDRRESDPVARADFAWPVTVASLDGGEVVLNLADPKQAGDLRGLSRMDGFWPFREADSGFDSADPNATPDDSRPDLGDDFGVPPG